MIDFFVSLFDGIKPANVLLIEACIIILVPYLLWKPLQFGRVLPLGVVQIFAGILLGPALFGSLFPDIFQTLFKNAHYHGANVDRSTGIAAVANIAISLFGFLTGADADKQTIAKSGRNIVVIGAAGMLAGYAVGLVCGAIVYQVWPAARGDGGYPVAIFAGAYALVVAVSALPILALILRELKLTSTRLGAIALASAGLADSIMWLFLAITVAFAGTHGGFGGAIFKALAGGLGSIFLIKLVMAPILERMMRNDATEAALMSMTALAIFAAAATTAVTDLHPVLGAFVAGLFLPDRIREMAAHKLDQPVALVLMPFFFLNTGLQTNFSLADPTIWQLFAFTSIASIVGKVVGHGLAARAVGEPWPFAFGIGILLQSKGLMEIIVITVFRDQNIVSQTLFSAVVLMCVLSTGLPTPLLRLLRGRYGAGLTDGSTSAVPMAEPDRPRVASVGPADVQPAIARLEFADDYGVVPVVATTTIIGRHADDDVRVNDIRVSRHHARLSQGADGFFMIENETASRSESNPITINGKERERAKLADGDVVSLNGVSFVFRRSLPSQVRTEIQMESTT